jgi:hypothetical protein
VHNNTLQHTPRDAIVKWRKGKKRSMSSAMGSTSVAVSDLNSRRNKKLGEAKFVVYKKKLSAILHSMYT